MSSVAVDGIYIWKPKAHVYFSERRYFVSKITENRLNHYDSRNLSTYKFIFNACTVPNHTAKENREHGEDIARQLDLQGRGEVGVQVCGLETKAAQRMSQSWRRLLLGLLPGWKRLGQGPSWGFLCDCEIFANLRLKTSYHALETLRCSFEYLNWNVTRSEKPENSFDVTRAGAAPPWGARNGDLVISWTRPHQPGPPHIDSLDTLKIHQDNVNTRINPSTESFIGSPISDKILKWTPREL